MGLDRAPGEEQPLGDLGVGGALDEQRQHVRLPAGHAESSQRRRDGRLAATATGRGAGAAQQVADTRASASSPACSCSASEARSSGTGSPHPSTTALSRATGRSSRRSHGVADASSSASCERRGGVVRAALSSGGDRLGVPESGRVGPAARGRQRRERQPGLGAAVVGDRAQQRPEAELVQGSRRAVRHQGETAGSSAAFAVRRSCEASASMALTAAGITAASRGPSATRGARAAAADSCRSPAAAAASASTKAPATLGHRHLQRPGRARAAPGPGVRRPPGPSRHEDDVGLSRSIAVSWPRSPACSASCAGSDEARRGLGVQHLEGRLAEHRLDPGRDQPVLGGHLGRSVEQRSGRLGVAEPLHLRQDHQGVAQLPGVRGRLRPRHGLGSVLARGVQLGRRRGQRRRAASPSAGRRGGRPARRSSRTVSQRPASTAARARASASSTCS